MSYSYLFIHGATFSYTSARVIFFTHYIKSNEPVYYTKYEQQQPT